MHRLCCIKFASREGSSENTTYRTPYCTGRETRSEWCGFDEKTMKRENAVPIDRGWAWMILLANFLVVFLVIGFMSSFGIFFAEFMSEFNAPASSITIALSLQTVVFSLSSLLVLNIGSRVASIRTYIIVSGFFACSAYLISAVITDVSYLVLSHGLIFGIAYGFSYGPALVILGRYFDKKRGIASSLVLVDFVGLEHISGAMAINMLMQGLGLSISNPILGFLRDTTGTFHASFYLMGTTLIGSGSILFLEPLFRKKESLSIGTETLT
ncbi:monocarboxylate transporter 13-like isoform X8 [Ostrea edulis]|uniref:monocarboxylate transporter 13-like isoform X8 n=1 Tax=Ostrea edulis TaxID=37623 RepID=UPI0024AE8D6E|nr:monocarboxylate transporter 13-like isoform X8 [Ostrea edulis]